MGDFNLSDIDWDCLTGNSSSPSTAAVLNLVFSYNLTQILKDYTIVQSSFKSLLDLFILSGSMLRHPYIARVLPGISDHIMVCLSLHFQNVSLTPTCNYVTYQNYEQANDEAILDDLAFSLDMFGAYSQDPDRTTDVLRQKFKNIILDCINKYVPDRSKERQKNHHWITRKIIHKKQFLD